MSVKFRIPAKGEARRTKWPVKFKYPSEDGALVDYRLTATFEIISESECETILKGDVAETPGLSFLTRAVNGGGDRALLARVLKDLDGFDVSSGADPLFNDEVFEFFVDQPAIKSALITAYFNCLNGRVEKN